MYSSPATHDEGQFLGDIFTMPSFFVKHGYDSYDPDGWAITREFKTKVCLIPSLELLDNMHTVAVFPYRILT